MHTTAAMQHAARAEQLMMTPEQQWAQLSPQEQQAAWWQWEQLQLQRQQMAEQERRYSSTWTTLLWVFVLGPFFLFLAAALLWGIWDAITQR